MAFKVNASAEIVAAKLNRIVKKHSIDRNIHNSVGSLVMDRWSNFEFTAHSTEGFFHDCGGTVQIIPTGPKECMVEFVSDKNKCDREGHTGEIEEDLRDALYQHWHE